MLSLLVPVYQDCERRRRGHGAGVKPVIESRPPTICMVFLPGLRAAGNRPLSPREVARRCIPCKCHLRSSSIPRPIWRPPLTSPAPGRTLAGDGTGGRGHGAVRLRLHADPRRPDRARRRSARGDGARGRGAAHRLQGRRPAARGARPTCTRRIRDGRRDELSRGGVARPRQRARLGRGGASRSGSTTCSAAPASPTCCRGWPARPIRYLPVRRADQRASERARRRDRRDRRERPADRRPRRRARARPARLAIAHRRRRG